MGNSSWEYSMNSSVGNRPAPSGDREELGRVAWGAYCSALRIAKVEFCNADHLYKVGIYAIVDAVAATVTVQLPKPAKPRKGGRGK